MKYRILFLFLLAAVCGWGQTDNLNCPQGIINGTTMIFNTSNFTIIHAKGSDANFASYSPWRVYTNNTVTFTAGVNVQKINSITITATSDSYANAAINGDISILTGTGTISASTNGSTATIEVTGDDVTEIVLDPSAQTRWSNIEINYEMVATGDHTITVAQSTGGTITPGTSGVDDGEDISFTATADDCYTFSHWVVDGSNAGSTNPYEFTNVTENHAITAVFNTVAPYTITASAGANGSISPNGATSVNCGNNQSYTITPNSGYAVDDVLVDGVSVGAVSSYTFTDVTSAHTISASFKTYVGPWEDFEIGTKGSYASGNVTCTAGNWTMNDALIGNLASDKRNGSWSVRMQSFGYIQTNFDITDGLGEITINSANYGTDTGGKWKLQASTDGGSTWTAYESSEVSCTTTLSSTTLTVNLSGNVRIKVIKTGGNRINIDDIYITPYSTVPAPKISVTPIGNYGFGNQLVGTNSTPATFTIENIGNADLTIGTIVLSGTNADQFSVTQVGDATLQEDETTTFTVTFNPTSLGNKTATVTIPNNDEDYTFTVTGNGSNSADSDIVANAGYTYTSNINYATYQIGTITSTGNSVGVFQFMVRDGGGSADADSHPTTLTALSFNYTGTANTIRAAALFNGNAHIANGTVTANGINFSGLNIEAPDNGNSPNITLRVSFTENVVDNDQLQFTVASATADSNGSVFGVPNAGGAASSTTGDRNRIEVVTDRLAFTTQPTGTSVNTNLAPFVISAVDQFSNTDLDASNSVTLTTSGTGMTASPSYAMTNGVVSISDVQFDAVQTAITITATTTGLAHSNSVTSTTFDISDLATGTYRTTSNGTWPNNGTATWERLTASGWNAATPGVNTTDLLIIRHTITSNASFAATGGVGTKMIVENGGTFNGGHNCTFGELTIKQGGVFSVNDPAVTIKNTAPIGTLTVENGGKLILNSATLDNADGLWRGEENFYPESILEIKNWDWDASGTGNRRLVGSTNPISINSEGYYFGHIHFDATVGSDAFVFVQPTGNHKLCNDLIVKNGAASPNVILTVVNANIEIAGNVIAQQNTFSFGGVESSNLTHTVHGDIIGAGGIINLNQNSAAGATVFVDVKGNVDIPSGSQLISSDDGCKIIFSGQATTPQTISIAGTLGARVDFEVADEAEVHLINQHLNLANATNDFTVLTGGSLYFNYFNITGSGKFTQNTGGILKITDAQGVNTSGATGNVQTSSRTFSQAGHFHYVGNVTPQNTGNVFGPGSTTKRIVVNKDNATDIVNLGSGTGTTNELYIARGIFVETEAANINGSGALTIDDDGYYRTGVTSANTPRLTGTYTLANNSTVELNANADQSLTHGKNYGNLVFSNGGTTTSGTTPDIEGTITIKDDTTLNVGNNTFGKGITNLFMEDTSLFINGGSGVKPDAGGSYTLEPNTTIEFQGNSVTQIRTAPNYANVTVSGTNVTAGSTPVAGLTFQSGGTFTVKDGATFNVNNPDGFTGTSTSSIKNSGDLASIILEPNSTINYNHTGDQNITNVLVTSPANVHYQNLVISGSGTKTTATGNVIVNELTKVNAATLRIAETADNVNPNVITAKGGIQVTTGATALFENNAILMQDADAVNSGNIVMQRLVEDLDNDIVNQMDYVYWSSPVSPQGLQSFSPGSQYVLRYNETDDYFYYVNFGTEPNFILGKGYAFSAEVDTEHPVSSTGYNETYSFTGTPHNGDIEFNDLRKNSDTSQGFNLVGNPYPSNIHADDLFDANSSIYASVLFWTNRDYTPTQQGSYYSGNNYAIYNKTGGIPATNYGNAFEIPNGIIKTGQGFMVQKKETGTSSLFFNNDMRITTNGTFYQKSGQVDKDRFWLTMTTYQGVVNTTLIGYIPGATNDFEQDYDAELMGGADAVYTILGDKHLSIQGREYPFNSNEVIPLGVRFYQTGKFIIDIKDKEGIFDGSQRIYLKDKYLNKTHILSQSYYEFESHAGEYNDRFELFFRPSFSTSVVNPAWTIITQKQNDIFIYTSEDIIKDVEIVNLFGWPVYRQSNVNATELRIPSQSLGKQILVVKVKTKSGKIETKKIINK